MLSDPEEDRGVGDGANRPLHIDADGGRDDMTTPVPQRTTGRAPFAWEWAPEENHCFPDIPACYAIYCDGELVYIGQSYRLSSRLSSYHIHINIWGTASDPRIWATPWGQFETVRVKFKRSRRYGDWLMREARLIRRLQPRFNAYGVKKAVVR